MLQSTPQSLRLRRELRRAVQGSADLRYLHRLHCVLMVASGTPCRIVAETFGASTRSVERWMNSFVQEGLAALQDGRRCGRRSRLADDAMRALHAEFQRRPGPADSTASWNGSRLAEYIAERYRVHLGIRQCQRLLRQLRGE